MKNEFVAKFFQDIDNNILLQLFLVTSMAMEGELVHFNLFRGMFIQEFT